MHYGAYFIAALETEVGLGLRRRGSSGGARFSLVETSGWRGIKRGQSAWAQVRPGQATQP